MIARPPLTLQSAASTACERSPPFTLQFSMSKHALALGLLALFANSSAAHEDDPKILDRQAPYVGRGYRASQAANPRAFGLSVNDAGTTLSFDASNVQLLSWLPLGELGPSIDSGNDCWGYVSPSGTEYALMGTSTGTAFVSLAVPTDPQLITLITGPNSLWRDVKVYQDHAYSVSEGGSGIQVFDLSQIDSGIVTQVNTILSGGGSSATHNVAIDEDSGRLYRLGGSNSGMRIYSLANPSNPVFIGAWSSRYIHDAQFISPTSGPYAGRQLAYASGGLNGGFNQTGIDILDVTNPGNVIVLSNLQYPQSGYSHQCWLSEDGTYLYLNDELDENGIKPTTTLVFNVSDPTAPFAAGTFTNGNKAIGHNLYTRGNLILEANYRSGLRVFDTSVSQTNPPEIAYFDTYPESDSNNFNGLWSNYPFFPSGIVIGSDMEKGLFVWWVGAPLLSFSAPGGLPAVIDPLGDTLTIHIDELNNGDLLAGSVQMHYDDGLGVNSITLNSIGNGDFQADLPVVPCGQDLAFYFTAESTNGIVWKDPIGGSGNIHTAVASLSQSTAFNFTMQNDDGWIAGDPDDDAITGAWTRGNPNGTSAQPEDDHSPGGARCWFTGQAAAGMPATMNDVDKGITTLFTPVLDMSTLVDPVISYWRWYSNSAGPTSSTDVFNIALSDDAGSNWTLVELVGPTGNEVKGGWIFHQFRVTDFFTPTATMQMRFIARDRGDASIVEAAIDDFRVVENNCSDCNGNGLSDDFEILDGSLTDFDGNHVPDICDPMLESNDTISLNAGGSIAFQLDAGSARAGNSYWIFGSATGTAPGLNFGPVNLPLNFDGYFNLTLTKPSFGNVFVDYLGTLDGNGRASASFNIPNNTDPSLAGIVLHHAFTASANLGTIEYASNAVPVQFVP
ncbi:MAG: choice-of-anchor B domain-containing protein [Planctomycetota bacterium]|jgi:choice-of-anchor B domain-containing protein